MRGLHAVYSLALMKTAADGWQRKSAAETAEEYAERYPVFRNFAELYTELRYRSRMDAGEREAKYQKLLKLYDRLREQRKRGILQMLRRFFSLRGIRY